MQSGAADARSRVCCSLVGTGKVVHCTTRTLAHIRAMIVSVVAAIPPGPRHAFLLPALPWRLRGRQFARQKWAPPTFPSRPLPDNRA